MPFMKFAERLYRLKNGENVLGSDPGSTIRIPELEAGDQIGVDINALGSFVWAVKESDGLKLNGRRLGADPVAVFHGDQISLNGAVLVFVEDGKVRAEDAEAPRPSGRTPPEEAVTTLAPRPQRQIVAVLTRLADNAAFIIDRAGFRIGREKRCDLIIPDRSVSRLHAEITFSRGAYVLRDVGRSPTRVNGRKLREPYKLQAGDVVQVAEHEFRFQLRPASADEIGPAEEATPVMSAVPDAPTMMPSKPKGGRSFFWAFLLAAAAFAAWMLLG